MRWLPTWYGIYSIIYIQYMLKTIYNIEYLIFRTIFSSCCGTWFCKHGVGPKLATTCCAEERGAMVNKIRCYPEKRVVKPVKPVQ